MSQNLRHATLTNRPWLQTFQALTNPSYRRLYPAGWLWYATNMMQMMVASWLVLEMTDSPLMVSLVGVCRMMPMLVLGLVAGSLADRFPKKRLMVVFHVINLGVIASMTALLFADPDLSGDVLKVWHVYLAALIGGIAFTVDFSARRAFYSELFDRSGLVNAVALDSAAITGSSMLGPLLGGTLIFLVGFEGTYATMLGTITAAFVLLLTVPTTGMAKTARPTVSLATQVAEIVHTIRTNRTIWAVVMVTIALNFFGFPFMQMLPVIARDVLGAGSVGYGALAAATGIGSLSSTLVIATRGVERKGRLFCLGAMLLMVGIFFFALSEVYPVSFLLLMVAGVGMSGFATMQAAIPLQAVPREMRGRAIGAVALGIGSAPLGLLIVGPLAEARGPQDALMIFAAVGILVLGVLYWRLPVLRDRET